MLLTRFNCILQRKIEQKTTDEKNTKVSELEKQVAEPEIWRDVKKATEKNQELAKLQQNKIVVLSLF